MSVDPLHAQYAYNSPYAFSENRVVDGIELEGLEMEPVKDYFNRLLKTKLNTITNYLNKKASELAVYAINGMIIYVQEKTEYNVKFKFEGKYTIGGRYAGQLKHVKGVDIDLGSATMFSVSGEYNFSTDEWNMDVTYYGKDGKKIVTQGISATLPVEGIEVGVGVKHERTIDINTGVTEETKNSLAISVGAIVGATFEASEVKGSDGELKNVSSSASIGTGEAIGAVGVVEFDVRLEIKGSVTIEK